VRGRKNLEEANNPEDGPPPHDEAISSEMEPEASANGEPRLALHDVLAHHLAGGLNPLPLLIDVGLEDTGHQNQQASADWFPTE
jgi:hypothetical protein